MTEPGWAVWKDETPGKTQSMLKQKRKINLLRHIKLSDKTSSDKKDTCQARTYSRGVKRLNSWMKPRKETRSREKLKNSCVAH